MPSGLTSNLKITIIVTFIWFSARRQAALWAAAGEVARLAAVEARPGAAGAAHPVGRLRPGGQRRQGQQGLDGCLVGTLGSRLSYIISYHITSYHINCYCCSNYEYIIVMITIIIIIIIIILNILLQSTSSRGQPLPRWP